MAKIETLSQNAFDTKKAEVLSKELIRKEINISEFEVINDSTIKIQGKNVPITKLAFKRVLRRLRIPHAFARRFETGFGAQGLQQLIQMVKLAKANKNDQTVTLVVDPDKGAIVDILPAGYASISNESFVNFTEGYIDKYNLLPNIADSVVIINRTDGGNETDGNETDQNITIG